MGRTYRHEHGFQGEAEKDLEEDSKLKGPWTRWSTRVLAREFYQLT